MRIETRELRMLDENGLPKLTLRITYLISTFNFLISNPHTTTQTQNYRLTHIITTKYKAPMIRRSITLL